MSTITTINATDTITASRTVINTNFSNLNTDKIETSVLDTDTTLAANSDAKVATQKATKAYVDGTVSINASENTRGIVEEATDAEVTAGTATGATGAKLFVTPAKLTTRIDALTYVDKIEVDATEITHTGTTETTLFDVSIPGGTLSTNNAIRIKAYLSNFGIGAGAGSPTFALKYGGTTVASLVFGGATGVTGNSGWMEGYVVADGATNVQKGVLSVVASETEAEASGAVVVGIGKIMGTAMGTGAVDSTASQTLLISSDFPDADAGGTVTVQFWIVEVIR